jgi:hypothetical protein
MRHWHLAFFTGFTPPTSTIQGWDIDTASYIRSFGVGSQDTSPLDVSFSTDGNFMYIKGSTNDSIFQYSLSVPWNISTASYTQSISVSAQSNAGSGIFFSENGLNMYMSGSVSGMGGSIHQYVLSSPWNISTASYTRLFLTGRNVILTGVFFKPDGLGMYTIDPGEDAIVQYSLATPWDISTASLVRSYNILTAVPSSHPQRDSSTVGLFFKTDGSKMYFIGNNNDRVVEFNLTNPWDISTIIYTKSFSVLNQDTSSSGIFLSPDGLNMYMVGTSNDQVHQYSLTPPTQNTISLSQTQSLSIAGQDSTPQGIFLSPDGLNMYIIGSGSDNVYRYSLTSPGNISTASYVQAFGVSGQDATPSDIFFDPNGLNMYIVGSGASDSIHRYNLSSSWDISTASYAQSFSVSSQDVSPSAVFFTSNGLNMYMTGTFNDQVHQYVLGTSWNISTASFVRSLSLSNRTNGPGSIFFDSTGLKMNVLCPASYRIMEYTLSSAWDISTATYSHSLGYQTAEPTMNGLFINSNRSKLYLVGSGTDTVYEYNLS